MSWKSMIFNWLNCLWRQFANSAKTHRCMVSSIWCKKIDPFTTSKFHAFDWQRKWWNNFVIWIQESCGTSHYRLHWHRLFTYFWLHSTDSHQSRPSQRWRVWNIRFQKSISPPSPFVVSIKSANGRPESMRSICKRSNPKFGVNEKIIFLKGRSEHKTTHSNGCLIMSNIWVICWTSIWNSMTNMWNSKTFWMRSMQTTRRKSMIHKMFSNSRWFWCFSMIQCLIFNAMHEIHSKTDFTPLWGYNVALSVELCDSWMHENIFVSENARGLLLPIQLCAPIQYAVNRWVNHSAIWIWMKFSQFVFSFTALKSRNGLHSMVPIPVWCLCWMHRRPISIFPFAMYSDSMCSFSIRTTFPIRRMAAWCNCWSIRIQKLLYDWTQQPLNLIRPSNNIHQNNVDVCLNMNWPNNMPVITVTSIVFWNANCAKLWIYAAVHRSFFRTIFPMAPHPMWNARWSIINVWNVTGVSIGSQRT